MHESGEANLPCNGRLHLESDGANPGVVGLGDDPHDIGGEDGFLHDGIRFGEGIDALRAASETVAGSGDETWESHRPPGHCGAAGRTRLLGSFDGTELQVVGLGVAHCLRHLEKNVRARHVLPFRCEARR